MMSILDIAHLYKTRLVILNQQEKENLMWIRYLLEVKRKKFGRNLSILHNSECGRMIGKRKKLQRKRMLQKIRPKIIPNKVRERRNFGNLWKSLSVTFVIKKGT